MSKAMKKKWSALSYEERKTVMEQTPDPTFLEGADGITDERYGIKGLERENVEMLE
ncbi:hypothetical protein F441_20294, partial [Phytophthora nicotianae CJ01A1]